MKIKYKVKTNGQAINLQFVKDDYVAGAGETIIEGTVLPDIFTLHTQAYKDYLASLEAKKQTIADAIVTNLPTWAQVETAVNNIGSLADAKAFLLKLSKVVYYHIKENTT